MMLYTCIKLYATEGSKVEKGGERHISPISDLLVLWWNAMRERERERERVCLFEGEIRWMENFEEKIGMKTF